MGKSQKVILASGSEWRKRLLKKHGIDARIYVTDFKEKTRGMPPRTLAIYNACGKARVACKKFPDSIVIGVDTIGFLGKSIILKPQNRQHAAQMLRKLSGTTHKVISGLCILWPLGRYKTAVTTHVTFKKIAEPQLQRYLDSNQWVGKAGAYAIQGRAKGFVEAIRGDTTNVIGIPVSTVKAQLSKITSNHIDS